MKKFIKSFKNLILPAIIACAVCIGGFITINYSGGKSNAEFLPTTNITNDYPNYLKIDMPKKGSEAVNYVGNTIYLFGSSSYKDIIIGDDEITKSEEGQTKTNWAYIPDKTAKDPQVYSYFDFSTALSLYYDKTAQDIANSENNDEANLLKGTDINKFIDKHENSFTVQNISSAPSRLWVRFKLDTSNSESEVKATVTDKETEPKEGGDDVYKKTTTPAVITLNKEGIYTLAIPVIEYKTTNGGLVFESSETRTIYYNFMIFKTDTYFDSASGKPKAEMSSNVQTSSIAASSTHSTYYFYNYAYAGETNTLPKLSYDPNRFAVSLEKTDLSSTVHSSNIEYQSDALVQLDKEGNALSEEEYFAKAYIDNGSTNGRKANIVFYDLGVYDFSFTYLYRNESTNTLYNLHLENLVNSANAQSSTETDQITTLQNKKQRLYVYGYQAEYSTLDDVDPETNQPRVKDLKTYNNDTYTNQADITSQVNHYQVEQATSLSLSEQDKAILENKNPAQESSFNAETIYKNTLAYLNQNKDNPIKPVTTNQTPVKFINNVNVKSDVSKIYKANDDGTFDDNPTPLGAFNGDNQNSAGTYLYIIQYSYDAYLSELGFSQNSYYHYQIFYFTVTNTSPTVTVLDSNFKEINTTCYTNKNVYILNNIDKDAYDAKVNITLSAYDYNHNTYFFQDQNIEELSNYKFEYKDFVAGNSGDNIEGFNKYVAGKSGILIETTSEYANALFTIKISSANTEKPSVRTFTIDTSPISNIVTRNVSPYSATQYKIGDTFTTYNTNQPLIFSWDEKVSGAPTTAYVHHIPMTAINYYANLDDSNLTQLLNTFINADSLPVSYKIDFQGNANWTEYFNTKNSMSTIDATKVKTKDGFYILQVYDAAGNSEFKIFLIDSTAPIFVKLVNGTSTTRSIFTNGESISIPETNTKVSIIWTSNKLIKLENVEKIKSLTSYPYGVDVTAANAKLKTLIDEFFKDDSSNENLQKFDTDISTNVPNTGNNGITEYKGTYLKIGISDTAYVKDGDSDNFVAYKNSTALDDGTTTKNYYQIKFRDESGKPTADNRTFQILLRDASNTYLVGESTADEAIKYRNYPSAFISFNVTADASKMMLETKESANSERWVGMGFASYSLEGDVYSYETGEDPEKKTNYTHLNVHEENGEIKENTKTDYQYKFSYYAPNKGTLPIRLSYIPVPNNGSSNNAELEYVRLKYYPYEKRYLPFDNGKNKYGDTNYYYFYDLAENPTRTIDVYSSSKNSGKTYQPGDVETFDLAIDQGKTPPAGKYVIERIYKNGVKTGEGNYDYFMRTLTLIVDGKNLITPLETVSTDDKESSSLESLVGGDITLSLYSGSGNSSIEVSFPQYNEKGLSEGSFFSTSNNNFTEDTAISFAISGNKLPVSLYIPSYKYTEASVRSVDSLGNVSYKNYENGNLSYYGNAYYVEQRTGNNISYNVYVEDSLIQTCSSRDEAENLVKSASITEYQIVAKVHYILYDDNNKQQIREQSYYRSDGTSENGFLKLYEAPSENAVADKNKPVTNFYKKGYYEVTIYQAYNSGTKNNFYTLYKFGFEIISQAPNFDLLSQDGNYLVETPTPNTYYTNTPELKVQWEVPTSKYLAKIDEEKITVVNQNGTQIQRGQIQTENNMHYFTINTEGYLVGQNQSIKITMQYEGHNPQYYQTITKTIYFDRSAPSTNINTLINKTETATDSTFSSKYQLINMRDYYDYKHEPMNLTDADKVSTASYSYTTTSNNFKFYSYNVTQDYFKETLVSSLKNDDPKEVSFIYYRLVDSIQNYKQVDKNSFTRGSYQQISATGFDEEIELVCGFYEIVELDYAGNMTVYLVQLTSSDVVDDLNESTDVLTYTNDRHNTDEMTVDESVIKEGYTVYSNSGFDLKKLSYKSDAWGFYVLKKVGENDVRYMCSPWIGEGNIYRLTLLSTGLQFETVSLSSLFENVNASSQKHRLTLTNRIDGTQTNIYLAIMDPALSTQKVADPTQNSAILNITVPTKTQVESTTTGYIFPVNIKISQYNNQQGADKWTLIMDKTQSETYGEWTTKPEFENNSAVQFNYLPDGTILQISINLGANNNQKIKYEILDNFGNTTTIIQLATEVSYKEITGQNDVYELPESDGNITYLSSGAIYYSYNTLLYKVEIYANNELIASNNTADTQGKINYTINQNTNIATYTFKPSSDFFYDDLFSIKVYDVEGDENTPLKTLFIRLYYKLPHRSSDEEAPTTGGIVFYDKFQKPIEEDHVGQMPGYKVNFNGTIYTATAELITTFSENVTVRFYDGQSLNYRSEHRYEDGYTYSVWLSIDNGNTWQNINSTNSANSGYTISYGVGDYLILVKYDDNNENVFTQLCNIYEISILDSTENYYYITVDGMTISKSDVKYYSNRLQKGIEINYIVSVNFSEKDNRLRVFANTELNVIFSTPVYDETGSNVTVEIWKYTCGDSSGEFTIIYIPETRNITSAFTYENSDGNTLSLISDTSSATIVADEHETNFNRLKLTYSSYYGIEANKINVEVTKLFDGNYVKINTEVINDGQYSYFYLTSSGSYRIRIYDSCSPANIQYFNNSQNFDLIFLSEVPFTVTNTIGEEETITEPIQNAVYNGTVVLKPTNISTYYQANGTPVITVKRNGVNYQRYTAQHNTYTFTEAGYYSVIFNATSTAAINHDKRSVALRTEEYNFIILNKNESRYAFEFTEYSQYYIEKIEKIDFEGNAQDITQDMLNYGNFPTITLKDEFDKPVVYLAGVTINYLDEKTGGGHYRITVNSNNYERINLLGENFTFEFWINVAIPPITVSIAEGDKTTKNINVSFNVQNLYDAVGDCYIVIADTTKYYTAETLSTYSQIENLSILANGTYYIQLYTMGGHLLYSYKVIKSEPLNAFAILAIVLGSLAVCAVIVITIILRKKHKIK